MLVMKSVYFVFLLYDLKLCCDDIVSWNFEGWRWDWAGQGILPII